MTGRTFGSLFSGIGGFELGLARAGWGPDPSWQVEIDPLARQVLDQHYPHVKRFDDVKAVGARNLEPVDLIAGGFPCQGTSSASAGKGKGLADGRSGLWFQFARIIRKLRPRWVAIEHPSSGADKWFDRVCSDLAESEYEALAIPLSAYDVGAPHRRARVFIIARDSHADRQPMGAFHAEMARVPSIAGPVSTWAKPPSVPVANGFPHGMGLYGNSIVPDCAEVVGWMMRELDGW